MREYENYESYDYDRLTEGSNIQIDHTIYVTETDMSDLISKPISEIRAMREESVTKEKTAFEFINYSACQVKMLDTFLKRCYLISSC